MRKNFSTGAARLALAVLLGSGALLTGACSKDTSSTPTTTPTQDFSVIDEAIIRKYLDDNRITTAQRQTSGLYFQQTQPGTSTYQARANNTVYVLYTGRLMDGTVFDASSQRNNVPINFVLGQGRVIRGWDEGIALMHKGEKATLYIPSGLAYGSSSPSTAIPANSVLRFDVELVDVR